jgi:EAL domain-containing protein (putative c-di-GMP-specific phosphodiesterase class I)/CHASE2 domain-containing sensor protein
MPLLPRLLAPRRLVTFGAAVLAGALALYLGWGLQVDEAVRMTRAGFRLHPASGEVHIVEIDGRSIGAVARWPWPRRIHAAAVDRLREAGVRSIAFDVDFSSPSDRQDDLAFAAALDRAGGSVILPTFRQYAGAERREAIESAPIPLLARHAFLAAANVDLDSDGGLRRMLFGLEIGQAPRPSLAGMVAERTGAAGESFAIDTSLDPATIPRHSMIDLLSGRIPAAALRGKRIIVGGTAVELGDRYTMPHHGVIPGVVAQAMGAETLLGGAPPPLRSPWWGLAAALALTALAVRPKRRRIVRTGLFAAGCLGLLGLALSEGTVGILPLGPAAAALAAATLIGGGYWIALHHAETRLEDPETGLPNLLALERIAGGQDRITVAAARIEGFASLASALGAETAAALVRTLADRLRFAADCDTVYRADEATLAWLDPSGEPLEERIDGIAALMAAPIGSRATADVRLHYGAAIGPRGEARQLAVQAGLAAGRAAVEGRRLQRFTAEDGEAVSRDVALLAQFSGAIADGEIWIAYQPKLDLASGEVTAVEALVRWRHPIRGAIPPDGFVPLLEQNGRAAELTLHVLTGALRDAGSWAEAGRPLDVAVNVSASLLRDEAAMEMLRAAVRDSGFPPERLTIEVTETAAMADPERGIEALKAWRALGVGVSIDDYGTGQSSLAYLQKLPATELKIDKSFVATIADEPRNAIMVRSTIAMAHELGLKVVAEGVEDEPCLALLREMGCDLVQGWLVARPMPAAEVAAFQTARSSGRATGSAEAAARFASRS